MRTWKTWKPTVRADPLAGFEPVRECDIPCVDVWPAGTLTDAVRAAYDSLARRGELAPQSIGRTDDGKMIVRYRAKIPHAWQLEELGREKRRILDEAKKRPPARGG